MKLCGKKIVKGLASEQVSSQGDLSQLFVIFFALVIIIFIIALIIIILIDLITFVIKVTDKKREHTLCSGVSDSSWRAS